MLRIRSVRFIVSVLILIVPFLFLNTYAYAEGEIFVESGVTVDSDTNYFTLEFKEDVEVKNVTSSNTKVIIVDEEDEGETYGTLVYLYVEGPGKSTITATDSNGNTDTCLVTVEPDALALSETNIVLDKYDAYYSWEEESPADVEISSTTNNIKSVTSSDKTVAKATLTGKSSFKIIPISAGTVVITATDIYNQTADVKVDITKKYCDEMKYLSMLMEACNETYMEYGETQIDFMTEYSTNASALKNVNIQVEVGGVKYKGKYVGYSEGAYRYTVKGIPIKPVGTKTKYTLSIGEAIHIYSNTIKRKNINSVDNEMYLGNDEKYSFAYTGKAIKPMAHVKCYYNGDRERILKINTDYKVKYSNNRNVGTAKVTVTGIGNYSGTSTVTFTIYPKGTTLLKPKADKKMLTVKWKKQSTKMAKTRVTGYQIRYSTKKNMSGAKSINVKGYSKTTKQIKKLKAKTRYYIQVRTYKTVSKKTYYSKWSARKSIKTK